MIRPALIALLAAISASLTAQAQVVLVAKGASTFTVRQAAAPAADPAILFADLPDTLNDFRPIDQKIYFKIGSDTLRWFEIHWRSENGTDLLVNSGYYTSDDSIVLPYIAPSAAAKRCYFWAWCSTDRTSATTVWSGETRHIPIRENARTYSLIVHSAKPVIPIDDTTSFIADLSWQPDNGEVFPYFFCDIGSEGDTTLYARGLVYDIHKGHTKFVMPIYFTNRAGRDTIRTLRIRSYLADAVLEDTLPIGVMMSSARVASAPRLGPSTQRLRLQGGRWFVKDQPIFLCGANVVSNWLAWDSTTIESETDKMATYRLNYIRLWIDWSVYEPRPGVFADSVKRKLGWMLRATDRKNIFVEVVPVANWGTWNFDLYRDHWWTDTVNRAAQYRYFYDIARTIAATGAKNIAYVSLMQEGGSGFDWFDAKLSPHGWINYPGPLDSLEALSDWHTWLAQNNLPVSWTYDSSWVEFGRWSSERFNDLIALRRRAVRDATGDEFYVGLEGGQGGIHYDRRIPGYEPTYYLKPERWAHLVDIAESHNYLPGRYTGFWDYKVGLRTCIAVLRKFGVPANVGEYQYTWAGHGPGSVDNDSMPYAWEQLRTKIDSMRSTGVIGCAIWSWADYDDRRFGLETQDLTPRPILDSLGVWLSTWQPVLAVIEREPSSSATLSLVVQCGSLIKLRSRAESLWDEVGREQPIRWRTDQDFVAPEIPGVYFVRSRKGLIARVLTY